LRLQSRGCLSILQVDSVAASACVALSWARVSLKVALLLALGFGAVPLIVGVFMEQLLLPFRSERASAGAVLCSPMAPRLVWTRAVIGVGGDAGVAVPFADK
jgi:hypothetical protein